MIELLCVTQTPLFVHCFLCGIFGCAKVGINTCMAFRHACVQTHTITGTHLHTHPMCFTALAFLMLSCNGSIWRPIEEAFHTQRNWRVVLMRMLMGALAFNIYHHHKSCHISHTPHALNPPFQSSTVSKQRGVYHFPLLRFSLSFLLLLPDSLEGLSEPLDQMLVYFLTFFFRYEQDGALSLRLKLRLDAVQQTSLLVYR